MGWEEKEDEREVVSVEMTGMTLKSDGKIEGGGRSGRF